MARLTVIRPSLVWQPASALFERCLPSSLFGRLTLLLFAVMLLSHLLALSLLFELYPRPMGPPLPKPPSAQQTQPPSLDMPPAQMLLDIGVRLGAMLLAAWIGARWLAAPVKRLAEAAQGLAAHIEGPPLQESGTRECREATRVINQLQRHIRLQLAQRDQFVAAVSHDLRTPLTRLALRAEALHDAVARQRFCKDITEMETMIRGTLDYLRGAADPEPLVRLDLAALLDSVVEDQQACGHPVWLAQAPAASGTCTVRAQPIALRRCIDNLVHNAVRYGGHAEVACFMDAQQLRVSVSDKGTGIPIDLLDQVLQPFFRLEASRHRHTGGLGLGLAVADEIATRHGGRIHLNNRPGGGLCAELTLPRVI
ncbi:MAG: ATP-binding protein [Hydrogenophaga sp.]|nr:ATP-binding protein [Hydrogenophaga sp.]